MINIPPEQQKKLVINRYFKKARNKMQRGYSYNIDQLCPVDNMTDEQVLAVMKMLDNHPLVTIDNELPKRWSLK